MGYGDNCPTCRAVSVSRRKRKRFAVSKEQNMAVYGMYDPPLIDPLSRPATASVDHLRCTAVR